MESGWLISQYLRNICVFMEQKLGYLQILSKFYSYGPPQPTTTFQAWVPSWHHGRKSHPRPLPWLRVLKGRSQQCWPCDRVAAEQRNTDRAPGRYPSRVDQKEKTDDTGLPRKATTRRINITSEEERNGSGPNSRRLKSLITSWFLLKYF